MAPKTRGANGKAKSHVFPTKAKAKKKGKDAKVVNKSKSQSSTEPPKKKARTETSELPKTSERPTGLLDVPPEIRLMIYGHVVPAPDFSFVRIARGQLEKRGPSSRIKPKRGSHKTRYQIKCCGETNFETTYTVRNECCVCHQKLDWAPMWICSLIRKEVIPILFERRRFSAMGLDPLLGFLKDLTPDQRASIRYLQVDHLCDQIITPKSIATWVETFEYIRKNLQLKYLFVDARSAITEFEDDVWMPRDPAFKWLYEICKMRNLEEVMIQILVYEPEIGYENWVDMLNEAEDIEDFVEIDEDGDPIYDSSFNWVETTLSEDITWRVAQKVLTPAAWKTLKEKDSRGWSYVQQVRFDMFWDLSLRNDAQKEDAEFLPTCFEHVMFADDKDF